ncbi:MAG: glycosyltransferase family 2 protein [Solobacterium sp.]|nr:glycosyltransferase family 2 protein [Solobacterium sp.]
MPKLLTVIVPCYNEEENIKYFYEEFCKNDTYFLKHAIMYQLIFVDDGSTDGTVTEIKNLHQKDKRVKLLSFSRNFGKEAAIYAGLQHASGNLVAIMDVDLQDPPSLLPQMIDEIFVGADQVVARRTAREGEPRIRSWFAKLFYKILNCFSQTKVMDGARDYRVMNTRVVEAVLSVTEKNRFSKGIFSWVGFNTKWVAYENVQRKYGQTKWSFWQLWRYAYDGLTAYSTALLSMSSFVGVLFCVLSFLMIIFVVIRKLMFGDPTAGWPSLVCIILLASGLQLLSIGVIGQYLAKTYMEVKNRPVYIVKEKL